MSGNVLYPSDAQLSGGLTIEQMMGAVGGNVVAGLGNSADAAITYKVTSDREGPYQLNINYASPSIMAQKINLTVNGSTTQVSLPSTSSTHLYATLNMTIYLQKGENVISISCDGGPIVYECEVGGSYTSCNSKLAPPEGYVQSGGLAVGGLRSGSSEFTMRGLNVPKDGKYKVIIYVASGDKRTFRLKVNGEDTGKLYSFQTGHFHKFQAFEIELDLKEGDNTLTFYGYSYTEGKGDTDWMPNFDYVILPDVKPEIEIRIGAISIE